MEWDTFSNFRTSFAIFHLLKYLFTTEKNKTSNIINIIDTLDTSKNYVPEKNKPLKFILHLYFTDSIVLKIFGLL